MTVESRLLTLCVSSDNTSDEVARIENLLTEQKSTFCWIDHLIDLMRKSYLLDVGDEEESK